MGKLFELLAVEVSLATKAKSLLTQIGGRFGDAQNYLGQHRTYNALFEDGQLFPDEDKQLPGTVKEDLDLLFLDFGRWLDASIQKEVTNQKTKADIEIDGRFFFGALPAPALLNLEGKLVELGKVLKSIPVNDLAQEWKFDEQVDSYVSRPRLTYRTEKKVKTHVAYEATKEHPAQVQTYHEDIQIGEWTTIVRSGMLQSSEKRELVERWETLSLAVKQARQRANDIEVESVDIATVILSYLRGKPYHKHYA